MHEAGTGTALESPGTPWASLYSCIRPERAAAGVPRVFILTFCRNADLFYGTSLVFETLRVGFPDAAVSVLDNCSLPEVRGRIEGLARDAGCRFGALADRPVAHDRFLQEMLRWAAEDPEFDGPLVFLDPDVCLWKSCQGFAFDGLMAGKLGGRFTDPATRTVTQPRLHTSFLWIPQPRRLWDEILRIKSERFDFEPFLACSLCLDGTWIRYDTGASLLAALPERMSPFGREHLDHYDHIYAGSHLDWLQSAVDAETRRMFERVHGRARAGDLAALRGIWRYQDAVFHRSTRGGPPPGGTNRRSRDGAEEDADRRAAERGL